MKRQFVLFLVAVALVATAYSAYRYVMRQWFQSWCIAAGDEWDAKNVRCGIVADSKKPPKVTR